MSRSDLRKTAAEMNGLNSVSIHAMLGKRVATAIVLSGGLLMSASAPAQDMKPATQARAEKSAVLVFTALSRSAKGDTPQGSGSGFFINSTGLCVTNNHVVDPTHSMVDERERQAWSYQNGTLTFTVVTESGTDNQQTYECNMLYQTRTGDQALMQCLDKDGQKLKTPNFLRLLPESRLRKDMKVWALGFPGGDSQRSSNDREKHARVTVTKGNVLDVPRSPGGRLRIIYTDVTANRGNSGGPMVDIDGMLLGAVTLKSKPEDREDTGGSNYSALSPNTITREMLWNAYTLKKIPDGTDFTPFIKLLTNDQGRIDIPEFRRQRDQDVMFYPNGDRIYGTIATNSLRWESPIGALDVPTEAIAYVMKTDEGASLFLEGGNRIVSTLGDYKFKFKPQGGAEAEHALGDVAAVGFKSKGRRVQPVDGKVVVFDSDLSHLVLADVQGTVNFASSVGPITIGLEDIVRLEMAPEGDKQVVLLTDDRRLTGRFGPEAFTAKIAAVGTPIKFSLEKVSHAIVEVLRLQGDSAAGLDLVGVLSGADSDIVRIARLLEFGDAKMARAKLIEVAPPDTLKNLPARRREQVNLLDSVASLREGQYEKSKKSLRTITKSEDGNISAFASAYGEVLKKYDTQYDGKPLSDRSVFVKAGRWLADEYLRAVRESIAEVKRFSGERRADYTNTMNTVRKYESNMGVAAVFAGTDADDETVRLWKLAIDATFKEIARIEKALQEGEESGNRRQPGRAPGGKPPLNPREIQELRTYREEAQKTLEPIAIKYFQEYGFRIEDQDIQVLKERKHKESGKNAEDEGP